MKKFRFAFSPLIMILLFASILLTLLGIVFNVKNVIEYYALSTHKTIVYAITLIINVGLFVIIVSLSVNGCYLIKGNTLYSCFGIIKTKTDIFSVVSITHYKKTKKLVLFFNTAEYSSIIIAEKDFSNFVEELRKINQN